MIGLYLIAAHLVGDFVIQNRWHAAYKLGDVRQRMMHVVTYSIPFWPIATVYGRHPWWHIVAFTGGLVLLHFVTDGRRFLSTLGDVVQWSIDRRVDPGTTTRVWVDYLYGDEAGGGPFTLEERLAKGRNLTESTLRWPPPNPWPATALMVDQTLHICQLAILAALFLR